jgi:GYF domain 2
MQERVVEERDAERVEPSWYLSRDGQQIGPMTDRELSLFAEGGNFKPGDLLWTAGLDAWKPAEDVFGLKTSEAADAGDAPETGQSQDDEPQQDAAMEADGENDSIQLSGDTAAGLEFMPSSHAGMADVIEPEIAEPDGDDVTALVQALKGETEPPKRTLKERALDELKKFAGAFVYLWVVFTVLLLHEWIVLSDHHIGFAFYGLATLNAIGLGKILIVAEHFRFAERLREKPLVYPIAYKTVAFTTLLFAAYTLEMMLFGWIGGHGFLASMPSLGGSLIGAAALWLIFCVALMPYFAFKELERAVGPDMIRKLLLGAR